MDEKRIAMRLASQLWEDGYDYSDYTVCPINAASLIGRRPKPLPAEKKVDSKRPNWCLFGKLTQHVETILFREKFLDWPNMAKIIKVKDSKAKDVNEAIDGSIVVSPCDAKVMIKKNVTPVDFILETTHLGRGTGWYDEEVNYHILSTIFQCNEQWVL